MSIVRIVQMAAHQVIDVIPMGHWLMPAALAMDMSAVVAPAIMGCAVIGIPAGDLYNMFIKMIAVWAMKVPIVQIIRMIAVANGRMAASFPMQVGVPFVEFMVIPQSNAFYNKSSIQPNAKH